MGVIPELLVLRKDYVKQYFVTKYMRRSKYFIEIEVAY